MFERTQSSSFIFGQFPVARKLIINGGAIRPTGLLFPTFPHFSHFSPLLITSPTFHHCPPLFPLFRSTGPIAVARRRSVGRSVGLSVNTCNMCNSATNFRIFFKIGGNIPWVNISRPFFRFCKILNFEFLKNKFQFKKI